ncbi:HAMP domain-containing histidine kinase [bacterium]|nr:HAMP domain-containing histidine kinase [bacterium]
MTIPFVIYLLIPSSFLIMTIGIYTYFKVKNKESLIFLFLTISQSLFSIGSFFLWNSCDNGQAIVYWDRLLYVPGVIMPALIYHFSVEFCELKGKHYKIGLYLAYIAAAFFVFISQTDFFVSGYFNYEWGCHTKAQTGHHFFFVYALIFVTGGIFNLFNALLKEKKGSAKRGQVFAVFLAFFFFSFLTISILSAYQITTYPIFYLGLPAFALFMTYAITEKNIFVSVVATDALTMAIFILASTFILFPEDTLINMNVGGKAIILLLFFAACGLLAKKNHEEIERKEEAERVSKMKSEFISISSNQLRTPLGAIRGYASMIMEGDYGKINNKMKEPLLYINDASVRMIKLVNSLLDVSRLERGKLELKISKGVSIEKIVKECIEDVNLLAKEKNIYIKYKSEKKLPLITGDEEKLKEAIHNIINNAILYTQKGGISVNIEKKKNGIIVQIKDTGIGMDKEDIEKIFKSFSRGAGAQVYTQGTGLGLFVAKNFIEMHNGKLKAISDGVGRGSLFCIRLPIKGNIAKKHDYSLNDK